MDTKERKAPPRQRRQRTVAAAPKGERKEKRVIRAPKEDIPEAVYTMPQPFRRGQFLLRLVSVVAVVIAMLLAVSIFFKVDTVTVQGAEKYTAWQIREASGIQEGDGLLTLGKARAAGKIMSELPYVDDVKISVKLPGTVHIEVFELDVAYAIEATDSTWWLISSDGKVVEQISTSAATGYTRILGVQADAPRVDQMVSAAAEDAADTAEAEAEETQVGENAVTLPAQTGQTNAQRLQTVLTIVQSLESNGVIGQIASIDVTSLTDIQLQYGQQFQVKLGSTDRLDYKISYMAQAVKQMEQYQIGVLDLTFEFREEGIFTPAG